MDSKFEQHLAVLTVVSFFVFFFLLTDVTLFSPPTPVQIEPAVSVLRRGDAVRDGKRVVDEETLALGKVRHV